MKSETLEQGDTPRAFAAYPLKVMIYDVNTHYPIYESRIFEIRENMNIIYLQDRIWFVTENLYNFSSSVDLDVPKCMFL